MAVITTAQYKAYAGISGSTLDARLDILIPALQSEVETYCGRLFDTATFTEYVDGGDFDGIRIRNSPITSITSITLIYPDASTTSVYASTDYGFSTREDGRIWLLGGSQTRTGLDSVGNPIQPSFAMAPAFPEGRDNIKVIYVGAFGSGAATTPPGLQLAMYKGIDEYLAQTRVDMGLTSETLGRYSYTRATPPADGSANIFSPQQLARFNAYRRVSY